MWWWKREEVEVLLGEEEVVEKGRARRREAANNACTGRPTANDATALTTERRVNPTVKYAPTDRRAVDDNLLDA